MIQDGLKVETHAKFQSEEEAPRFDPLEAILSRLDKMTLLLNKNREELISFKKELEVVSCIWP